MIWKSISFCKIRNNVSRPIFFIRTPHKQALQNMKFYDTSMILHGILWTWNSILWTCQKWRILLSARQGSSNYLELSKETFGGWGDLMQSHWPCLTWKFIMIWFHKILKLIFQKQPSCPRVICTEHWKKLPNLTTSKILVEFSLSCIFHRAWKKIHFVVFTFLENTLNLCIFTHAQLPTQNSVSLKTKGGEKAMIFLIQIQSENMKITWNISLFIFCMILLKSNEKIGRWFETLVRLYFVWSIFFLNVVGLQFCKQYLSTSVLLKLLPLLCNHDNLTLKSRQEK